MRITQLESIDFPPFKDLKLEFRETKSKGQLAEVQLLTGINGTGKTRILSLLAAFLGNSEPLVRRFGDGRVAVTTRLDADVRRYSHITGIFVEFGEDGSAVARAQQIGDAHALDKYFPAINEPPALAYSGSDRATDKPITVMAAVQTPRKNELLSFQKTQSQQSSILFQQLANIKMQSALDHLNGMATTSKWNVIMKSIEDSVSEVTGQKFSFNMQAQPQPRLSVNWRGSTLSVDLLPDGLRSLIGWMVDAATMISLLRPSSTNPLAEPSIILLDEPETHLHPEWQRLVLPVAQRLFPGAQIFVATHSPFILSSVNDGWIHKLVLNDDGTVSSTEPQEAKLGDSFIDAAEDVLGIGPSKWFDPESEKLLAEFRVLREQALKGNVALLPEVESLGKKIAERGDELANIISAEMAQLHRLLKQPKSA